MYVRLSFLLTHISFTSTPYADDSIPICFIQLSIQKILTIHILLHTVGPTFNENIME